MINVKLMPTNNNGNDQMARTMRTTNLLMPLMSLFFAFTVPVGLGFYWITGSVIRIIQQLLLNLHFKKLDADKIIEANRKRLLRKQKSVVREEMQFTTLLILMLKACHLILQQQFQKIIRLSLIR